MKQTDRLLKLLIVVALVVGSGIFLQIPTAQATIPNRQPWAHTPGSCPAGVQGAVFAISGQGCGGDTTTFDTSQVYGHTILQDVATAAAPCAGIAEGANCFRMWYSGLDSGGLARIGYATSADGLSWSRVVGAGPGGSVLGPGPTGRFDSAQVSFPTVIRNGSTYDMWYTGGNGSTFNVGRATSTDGVTWTRVTGPLAEGAVLRISGVEGTFDQNLIAAPRVLLDQASPAAPCEAGRTSGACYRMWYQGVDESPVYVYRIGAAVSPDGLTWTRMPGVDSSGAVIGQGPAGTFDLTSNAVNSVIKDGALFRMWYNAVDGSGVSRIGHVVSTDGIYWVRPSPNTAVFQGSDDPGTLSPDYVWAPLVIRDGLTYRMWYNTSTRPTSQRIGYATVTPGSLMSGVTLNSEGTAYTLNFTTATAIPAGGSLLIALPATIDFAQVAAGAITGFDASATFAAEQGALSDGAARGVSRGALVIRLPNGAVAGAKSVQFTLGAAPTTSGAILIQTYDVREVLERGSIDITAVTGPQPTATPAPATATPTSTSTPAPTNTPAPTSTPGATSTPTSTSTPAPTNTPAPTSTPGATSTPTSTNTPAPTSTPAVGIPSQNPANRQPWLHIPGTCGANVQGAVFSLVGNNCGGTGTSFDTTEIFPPNVLLDTASAAMPCENGRTSGACYRMWYVGVDGSSVRRIGYALSPDGVTWTRYLGAGVGGSIFQPSGVSGTFDFAGVTTMSVVRDGGTFRMWYSGMGASGTIEGIGYATSTNGITWTRVPGSAGSSASGNANAVLVERGGSNYDQDYIVAPSVVIDEASAAAPCENGRTSGTCFRMWYEGVATSPAYVFAIGHAVSPDGVTWTRVLGSGAGGSVFSASTPIGSFDDNSVGVPTVVKDGAFYRMWYEAKAYNVTDAYSVGSVVSTDGITWVRPVPNNPVWRGSNDPGVFSPDEVWAVRALKLGSEYRLWYTISTRPNSSRFALASMAPGSSLGAVSITSAGSSYTLSFTSNGIPAGGSVLVTLPADVTFSQVSAGAVTGFGSATLVADPAAVTDAASGGRARGALLLRLPAGADAGAKTISFNVATPLTASSSVLVQLFDAREVLQYGAATVAGGATSTPTSTPVPPTSTPTSTPVPPTSTPTSTPVPPTSTPTSTPVPPTSTPTSTPVPPTSTPTSTPVPPTSTPTSTPVPPTSTPTSTPVPPTSTPTSTPVPPTSTPTSTPVPPTSTPTSTPVPPTSVAIGRPATQSSTYSTASASRAVDGNTNGNFGSGSVSHTNSTTNPWWQVDLGARYALTNITLWNRTDCCADRLANFYVFVSDTDMTGRSYSSILNDATIWRSYRSAAAGTTLSIPASTNGRYVRVQLAGTNFLQLAEVQVFGSLSPVQVTTSVTAPTSGSSTTAGNTVTFSATANPFGSTISRVEFYDGTRLIGTDTTSPYSISWTNVPEGTRSLTSRAYTASGQSATSSASTLNVSRRCSTALPLLSRTVTFRNNGTSAVTLLLVNSSCNEVVTTTIQPGASVSRATFYDQVWNVRNSSNVVILTHRVNSSTTVTIP